MRNADRVRLRVSVAAGCTLVLAAAAIPHLPGVDVHAGSAPPLLAAWRPRVGPGTLPALGVLVLCSTGLVHRTAAQLPWRCLLAAAWLTGVAWMTSLALVDGRAGIAAVLTQPPEYLPTARAVGGVRELLAHFAERIPGDAQDPWPVHVAGHPPGALLFFVALDRIGLGSGLGAGLAVIALAATTPVAVAVALRVLGVGAQARQALPFLVIGPAALWQAVSADAVFAATAAWATAALALAATTRMRHRGRSVAWSVAAGLLFGCCVLLSYALPLLAILAVSVLLAARRVGPLPVAAASAAVVVLALAALGYRWWEAFPLLRQRYWDGIAQLRPAAYWVWADIAALLVCAGPVLVVALGRAVPMLRRAVRQPAADPIATLVVAAVAMVVVADLSLMSKAEVERIWLPFVPWLLLSTAYLPRRRLRTWLVAQASLALVLQHLLWTRW